MKIITKTNYKNGQLLLEVLMATALIILIIVALVSAVVVSTRSARFASNKSVATKYVNQGTEAVRSIRETSWTNLSSVSGSTRGLQYNGSQWSFTASGITFDYPDTPANFYTRSINVTCNPPANDSCTVIVTVSWREGINLSASSSTIAFTKWKP